MNKHTQSAGLSVKETGRLEKAFTAIIVLMMWGYAYVFPFFPSLNFGEGVAILFVALIAFSRKLYIKIPTPLLLFFACSVLTSVAVSFSLNNVVASSLRMIRDAFYWVLICVFVYYHLDYEFFKKCLKIFCIVLSAILVLQVGIYYLTGVFIPAYPFFGMVDSVTTGKDIYDHAIYWISHSGYLKPYSFLSEASHCAQALFIGSLFLIKEYKTTGSEKLLWILVLYNVASVLTFSASAIIYVGVVFVLIMYFLFRRKSPYFVIGFIVVAAGFYVLVSYAGFDSIVERIIGAVSGGNVADASAFVRLYKGFYFWAQLPIVNKIFGIGFGNYVAFSEAYNIQFGIDGDGEFMSSVSYILVSGGIIAFLLLILFFVKLFANGNRFGKLMVISLFIMSMAASVYSTPYWIWFMVGILFNQKDVRKVKSNE